MQEKASVVAILSSAVLWSLIVYFLAKPYFKKEKK